MTRKQDSNLRYIALATVAIVATGCLTYLAHLGHENTTLAIVASVPGIVSFRLFRGDLGGDS